MSTWFVYILQCSDGTFYTGVTTDVERRLHEHNCTGRGAKYTRSRRPVRLVYHIPSATRSTATGLEYQIRKLARIKKLELITNFRISIDD